MRSEGQHDRALRLAETMSTAGWGDVMEMLEEQAQDAREEVFGMMSRKPETLTGRKAILLAGRVAALRDFRESIEDEVKILKPRMDSK